MSDQSENVTPEWLIEEINDILDEILKDPIDITFKISYIKLFLFILSIVIEDKQYTEVNTDENRFLS